MGNDSADRDLTGIHAPTWIARRDRLLSETAARLLRSDNPQAIVEDLCRSVMAFLDCDMFLNFLSDASTGRLRLNACAGVSAEEASRLEWLDQGESICRRVAQEGRRIIVSGIGANDDPRLDTVRSLGVQAYGCQPLLSNDRLLGTLSFGTRSRPRFREDEVELMETVANLVAIAIYRITAEQALRESEARYRELVQKAPAGIYEIDFRTGRFTSVNDAMAILTGYSRDELLSMSAFELLDEDSRSAFRTRVAGWLRGEAPHPNVEYRIRARDGREIVASLEVTFTRDEQGRPLGATVVGHDITERRKVEVALKESDTRLREADRRKDEFLAMLGHELRNPLAAITTAVDLMRLPDASDATRDRAREVAARQAEHMRRLVDDLLDVSRITQGVVTLRRETLALVDVVRTAVDGARPLLEAMEHRLSLTVPTTPPVVNGDPVRLAQVVGNLLNNAAKYTPPGGDIHVTVERRDGGAVLRVRDNGDGIAPELLPHVFDLFVQGTRGPDRVQGGLGVGLTMVKRLAEMHGGRVAAESAGPGRGSEFTVWLPLARVEGAKPETPSPDAPGSGSRRVLIVDDQADQAQLLAMLLRKMGHCAAVANSGREALDKAAAERPDVVLIDLGMPGMDGYELARRMRASAELAGVSLVAHTGYGGDEDRDRTREAGFDAHLVKPADREALKRVLS